VIPQYIPLQNYKPLGWTLGILFEQTWISSPKRCSMPNMVDVKKILKIYKCFPYFAPCWATKWARPFIWTNLNRHPPTTFPNKFDLVVLQTLKLTSYDLIVSMLIRKVCWYIPGLCHEEEPTYLWTFSIVILSANPSWKPNFRATPVILVNTFQQSTSLIMCSYF